MMEDFRNAVSCPQWIEDVMAITWPIIRCSIRLEQMMYLDKTLIYYLFDSDLSRMDSRVLMGLCFQFPCTCRQPPYKPFIQFAEHYPLTFLWGIKHGLHRGLVQSIVNNLPVRYNDEDVCRLMEQLYRLLHYPIHEASVLKQLDESTDAGIADSILQIYAQLPQRKRCSFIVGLALGQSVYDAAQSKATRKSLKTAEAVSPSDFVHYSYSDWLLFNNKLLQMSCNPCKVNDQRKLALELTEVLRRAFCHPKAKQYRAVLAAVTPSLLYRSTYAETVVGLIIEACVCWLKGQIDNLQNVEEFSFRQVNDMLERNDIWSLCHTTLSLLYPAYEWSSVLGKRPFPDVDAPCSLRSALSSYLS